MSLVFTEGFDHYSTAQAVGGQKWNSVSGATISTSFGAFGGQGCQLSSIGALLSKTLPNQVTYIAGVRVATIGFGAGAPIPILAFLDSTTSQVDVRVDSAGIMTATRNGTTLGTSSAAMTSGVFHYVELKATIGSGTSGSLTVRLDGAVVLSLTGINTQSSANAFANVVRIGNLVSSQAINVDDIYVCDTQDLTAAHNNDFLGDVKIQTLFATGAGSFNQFTRGGTNSGSNWSQANDTTPNDDTAYNVDATVGDRDSFKFTTITFTGNILGVMAWTRAYKDDAGSRSMQTICRNNAIDSANQVTYSLSGAYAYFGQAFEVDPNASAAPWTVAGLNTAEFGYKVIS